MRFDKHITPSPDVLIAIGITDAALAQKNLGLLRTVLGQDGFTEMLPEILRGLSIAGDPDMALNHFERYVSSITEPAAFVALCNRKNEVLPALMTIFGASRFLSRFLAAEADWSLAAFADPEYLTHPPDKAELSRRLADMAEQCRDEKQFFHAVRIFRKQEMLRLALRDLLGRADLQETVGGLSDLAEVALQAAYERASAFLRQRHGRPLVEGPGGAGEAGFSVIAMGKLGGRELNFSSDVDLMYVYAADGETEGILNTDGSVANRITNHQFFLKLAEKLSAAVGEKTEDGFVFRVDLRLRPEGQRGPLAQSLGGYEIYYESWGQTWERSALIKARPVAGDEAVGREFLRRITPFVYRKYLDYSAIAEIRDMKQKINLDVGQKGRMHRDVKLGYGGIREIEFIIQAVQLIYAGRDRSLREKNALKALHMLSQKGLITYQEQSVLANAYIFLRTVEHRIQVLDDLQTQTMPAEAAELRALARRTGYAGQDVAAEQLLQDYAAHTEHVRAVYDNLFAFTGDAAGETSGSEYDLLLSPDTSEQRAVEVLRGCGFRDAYHAYRNLVLLREGAAFVHQTPRSRKLFSEIFPGLFAQIVASSDPDMALNHLESFLAAQGSWEAFQSLVSMNAESVNVLVAVFANSEYLSRMLVGRPHYLQNLLEARKAANAGAGAAFAQELDASLEVATGLPDKLDALRRFKHQEELRIGMADLIANTPQRMVSRELSRLAEACLQAALRLAVGETAARYNVPASTNGIALIGVGKLGSRELTYGSDLDILFVYSEPRAPLPPANLTVFEYFNKIAEKTISYLSALTQEGFVFRVDTRLRPTGSKGPLAQSIEAFRSYYAGVADTWERQAQLRARFICGDLEVGRDFTQVLTGLIYRDEDTAVLARQVLAMRRRMEDEAGRTGTDSYNIKQGPGGLVDIEFLVQYLQLLHGKQYIRVRVPGTYNALLALKNCGLLGDDDHRILSDAYLFLRRLEGRMRIVSNQATSNLQKAPELLLPLALRMGYHEAGSEAGKTLLSDYEQCSTQVRGVFDRIMTSPL